MAGPRRTSVPEAMRNTPARLALPLLLLLAAGCCAAFRAGRLEPVAAWPPGPPPAVEELRDVAVAFVATTNEGGGDLPFPSGTWALYCNATHLAYHLSQRFIHVRPAPALADLQAEVKLSERHRQSPFLLRLASVLTLGIIPSWDRRDWTLVTTVTDRNGKEVGRFEKSEAIITWTHLFLVSAFPFAPPPGVAADCVFDLNRATIVQAHAQGVY